MFKKVAVFTDLHIGAKSNSAIHNKDCEEFVDWFIDTAKKQGCETGVFCGDYHHHRNNINIPSLSVSLRCLEKLGAAFDNFYFITGNHDQFYKDNRSLHSVEWAKHVPGITIINKLTTIGDVSLVPWLVGEEWKKIEKLKSKYIFGHFELPTFYMNAMIMMPHTGELQSVHFKNQDYVFSGHFHKRQNAGNIWYIGNAFPHNYADAWDDDRGMMILEHGSKPEFINWSDAPKFRTLPLSKLLDEKETLLLSKMHLKVDIDIDISFEEASYIKETFMGQHDIRELTLIPAKKSVDTDMSIEVDKFESIDTIVSSQIVNIESETYDSNLLLSIYSDL